MKILVLSYTPFVSAPRALKQVMALREEHDVTTAGFGSAPLADLPHVEIPDVAAQRWGLWGRLLNALLLLLRVYRPIASLRARDRVVARLLGGENWDIVVAHDLATLDAANSLSPRYGVILDLHEYAPRENEYQFLWRVLIAPYVRWMCRTKVPQAAAVVTVSQGIAAEYRRVFGFDSIVVENMTPYQQLKARPASSPIRLVHSGLAAVERRLEIMIDGVRLSSADVTLDLFLVEGTPGLLDQLRQRASGDPRVRFPEALPYSELVRTLNTYDVGLSILPPTTFNLAWCLPNKFFDFIQARLGVIVGPSPEMARFVEERGIGMVLPNFEAESLAAALDTLSPDQANRWKSESARHAVELSSESQREIWHTLVRKLTTPPAARAS